MYIGGNTLREDCIEVSLSWNEVHLAATVGVLRNIQALKGGLKHCHGATDEEMWKYHIEGASGEFALAKALNVHWGAHSNVFKVPDISGNIQVRTRSNHNWDLIVRDGDPDDEIFILVTGSVPNYRIVGWILGKDAKNSTWYKDIGNRSHPAYFVPQEYLNSMQTLPKSTDNKS